MNVIRDTPHGPPADLVLYFDGDIVITLHDIGDAAACERYLIALVNGPDEPKPIGWRARPAADKAGNTC
jgi:hypothetical protein